MANLNSYRNAYTAGGGYLTDVTGQNVTSMQGINVSGAADGDFLVYANSTTIVNESAATARSSLGVDASGTDNSTDVTVSGTYDYITLSGQDIVRGQVDVTTDVTGTLPVASGGTGATDAAGARTNLGVDASGTDNSTDVTLSGSLDYITISGQVITRNLIDLSTDVSGLLPSSSLPTTYTIDGGNAS